MKKAILLFVIAMSTLYVNQTFAQKSGKLFSFGFGIEGAAMMGDDAFKEVFSSEFGLSLRFAVKAGPGYATFTPGALLVIPKSVDEENIKVGTHIPLKLGYKYIFAEKFFVMGEAGYSSYAIYTADASGESDEITKEKEGGFTYAPSVGINLGKFEVGIRYEATKLKATTASMLGLRLGFNF